MFMTSSNVLTSKKLVNDPLGRSAQSLFAKPLTTEVSINLSFKMDLVQKKNKR